MTVSDLSIQSGQQWKPTLPQSRTPKTIEKSYIYEINNGLGYNPFLSQQEARQCGG